MTNRVDDMTVEGYCLIWGKLFSPSDAEKNTGINFDDKNEPGDIGSIGRYKGIPTPYGSASITFRDTGDSPNLISEDSEILEILDRHVSTFRKAGAEDIVLHVNVFYRNQCNLQLSPDFMGRLSMLDVPLALSAISTEDNEME